ncbi:DUF1016 N-terminal domain-containing protein [Burkholderia metallica]|uniref:DUF1016 N-terminal domain-containing protein n=1 Tax=Burkholderia metallica TaxID=488729 RepID=UPI003F5171BF
MNSELTMLYWRIGQLVHTRVLAGKRVDYGEEVLPTLATQLTKDYGGSFAVKNLRCVGSAQRPASAQLLRADGIAAARGADGPTATSDATRTVAGQAA